MSDTSSSEEDWAAFESAAVSVAQLDADRLALEDKQHKAAAGRRARRTKQDPEAQIDVAEGKGDDSDANSDDAPVMQELNASQLKIAAMLEKRLDRWLGELLLAGQRAFDKKRAKGKVRTRPCQELDVVGIRLFKRVKAGVPCVISHLDAKADEAPGAVAAGHRKRPTCRRLRPARVSQQQLEQLAVDGATLIAHCSKSLRPRKAGRFPLQAVVLEGRPFVPYDERARRLAGLTCCPTSCPPPSTTAPASTTGPTSALKGVAGAPQQLAQPASRNAAPSQQMVSAFDLLTAGLLS